ncbi:MAG: hypothetical protein IPK76_01820 [Lewinellaceae bacterium]|nr:hypothetical protein [Lewinellaceae bacterium]
MPPDLDLRQNGFGLESGFNRLDYRFNPRKGWSAVLKIVAGFNTVRRNSQIENLRDPGDPAFEFSSLYDSVAGRNARYRLETNAQYFIPVMQRSTVKLGLRSGAVFPPNRFITTNNTASAATNFCAVSTRKAFSLHVL